MSKISLSNETPLGSGNTSQPRTRTWAGTFLKGPERATHYLHLMASPCEKCKGPVVAGWVCRREDDITRETEISGIIAICLACGARPDALIDPLGACHFRPVEWEWKLESKPAALDSHSDSLPAGLSQDADHPESAPLAAEFQP